jgi:hypothetical protein
MTFDEIKTLAIFLLKQYETAWQENAALHTILTNYPMPDGTRGIPGWQDVLQSWLADAEGQSRAHERFAVLYDQIRSARQESDLLELLRKAPPVGGIQ